MYQGVFLGYGATVFTPWMSRQADNAVFTFEMIDDPDSATLTVTLFQKKTEEYGNPSSGTGMNTMDSDGDISTNIVSGMKEMFRFSFAVENPGDVSAGTGVVFRMLPATWYDEAK
jgi:hypothetical protein